MLGWFLGAVGAVSCALSWRLVGVIVESTDEKHRESARRTLATVWTGSLLGSGATTTVVKLYELGILG